MGSSVVRLTLAIVLMKMMAYGIQAGHVDMLCVDPTALDRQVTYDPSWQVCCNGAVYDLDGLRGQSCCGKQIVDRLTHSCCGTEAVPIDRANQQCCGGSLVYDSDTHMCCGNNVYPITDDFNMCCGNYPMNGLRDTCCQVMIGSFGMTAIPSRGRGQCCGLDLTYDPEVQMCCRGQTEDGMASEVVARGGDAACCGGRSYSTSHQVCCGETLLNITAGRTECCGDMPYNPDIQHCCAATVFSIGHAKCCGDKAYHPGGASCCHGVLHDGIPEAAGVQGCCGPVSFLGTESVCCDGVLRGRAPGHDCCGKDTYNSETHMCCAGYVRRKSSSSDACCGSASYDPGRETCCPSSDVGAEDQLFPVVNGWCCRTQGGALAFDPSKATCCVGKTYEVFYPDVPANTSTCCGQYLLQDTHLCNHQAERPVRKTHHNDNLVCSSKLWNRFKSYNSKTQVCVRGKIRSKNRVNPTRRCGPRTLDPDTEICCLGKIHPSRDKHGNPRYCCSYSIHSYVPQHQTCCSGRVDNIPSQASKCCRNRAYNTATHTCDRSGMVRQTSAMALYPLMCGLEPYHPSKNECCGGFLIGLGQTCCREVVYDTGTARLGGGLCCGGVTGYNPERDVCCGKEVHQNIQQGTVCCGSATLSPGDSSQTCCDGRLQSSSGGVRRNCSGGTAYNGMAETVCGGVVHPRPNGACCGKLLYDKATEVCCGSVVYPKDTPDTTCCGALPYDQTDPQQRCCGGSLYDGPAASSRCCGNQLFHPSSQHCCVNAAQHATYVLGASGGRSCNSLHSDNGAMYVLCKEEMHVARARGSCCGEGYVRNGATHMCCDGGVVPKHFGDNSMCCGSTVVDSSVTSC